MPATILSRCQRFDFKRISNEDIIKRLKIVCNESKIEVTEGAFNIIATLAEGAMRDALSILERCVQDGTNQINEDKIKDLVGIPKITFVNKITQDIISYDVEEALNSTDEILNDGKDIVTLLWEIIKYLKDILVYKTSGRLDLYSDEELNQIKQISETATKERLINLIYNLSELENNIKWSTQKTIMFQAGIINLCNKQIDVNNNLEERIDKIEKYLKNGNGVAIQASAVPISNREIQNNNIKMVPSIAQVQNNNITSTTKSSNVKSIANKKFSNKSEEYWPQIMKDLKQSGKIVLYTNLMGTKVKEINDMTIGIEFPNGMTSFGKTILEKQENIREISNLVSIACGKEMQIKYLTPEVNIKQTTKEENLKKFANESDIPFNIVE